MKKGKLIMFSEIFGLYDHKWRKNCTFTIPKTDKIPNFATHHTANPTSAQLCFPQPL